MPGNPVTRKRTLQVKFHQQHKSTATNGAVTYPIDRDVVIPGTQITTSEGHPWPSSSRGRNLGDIGGDFETFRTQFMPSKSMKLNVVVPNFFDGVFKGNTVQNWTGPIFPANPSSFGFPTRSDSSVSNLNKQGATAIARCKPTNSVADASIFLGELLREGLPSLVGSKTWASRSISARDAADDYLNVQFGWRPLVSDINKFSEAVRKASAVMKQYERDAGKVVRRKYNFPLIRDVVETKLGGTGDPYGPTHPDFFDTSLPFGDLIRTRETVRRQWFSGAFTYYLPSGYSARNAMDRYALEAEHLFGLTLTPETLWNLAPWSWAVDWFSNTGDVVSNLSDWASDGLVLRYGYIMEHTRVTDIYTMTRNRIKGNPVISPMIYVTETKIRRRANPFGFGLTWEGLSSFQASIIAALGLSKGR